jgi:thiol-disulfide isomerase/thioredoxin
VFPSFVSAAVADDTIEETTTTIDDEEPTCSLATTASSDCSTDVNDDAVQQQVSPATMSTKDLIGQVVSLTDDNFDELTTTHMPSTWLVMFKTNACGICKKALPVLESLSSDTDILEHNNREVRKSIKTLRNEAKLFQEGEIPSGPIYVATINAASWSSSDITKRFDIDATPTIILIRNEGYITPFDKHGSNSNDNIDSRSYYIYKEQRAIYPLRKFVLGEFIYRKRYTIPPVLSMEERKVHTILGRVEYYLAPGIKWAGGIVGKLLLVWFIFIGGLGLFLRVHNYAWGDKEDGDDEVTNRRAQQEKELEIEKAKGRKEWEEKEKARKANYNGDDNEEEEMKGKGVSVKKTGATPRNVTRLANPRKPKVK